MYKPHVHISDVRTFRNCRVRWDYSSNLRHSLTPKKPNRHLWMGSAVHYALAAYYGSGMGHGISSLRTGLLRAYDAYTERTFDDIKLKNYGVVPPEIHAAYELGLAMLKHYLLWVPTHDFFQVIMPEVPLRVDCGDFIYSGMTDGLVRMPDGTLWLLESKTYRYISPYPTIALSPQAASYVWAARKDPAITSIGYVEGILYNILGKTKPKIPAVLKRGGLSRNKRLNCSPELYTHVVKHYGYDLGEYTGIIAALPKDKFFRRYPVTFTEQRMKIFEDTFIRQAQEMIADPFIYPADPLRACGWCDFRQLCELRLYGLDWQAIAKVDYEKRIVREPQVEAA